MTESRSDLPRGEPDETLRPAANGFGSGEGAWEAQAETAAERFFRRDYIGSLRQYSRLLALDGSRAEGWAGYVVSLLFQGDPERAKVWALNAEIPLRGNPCLTPLQILAEGRAKAGRSPAQRLKELRRAESEDPLFLILRGAALLELREDDWLEAFRKALSPVASGHWRALMLAGRLLERREKREAAREFFRRAKAAYRERYGGENPVEPETERDLANPKESFLKALARMLRKGDC